MSLLPTTTRPDLSGLKLDDRARRPARRGRWMLLVGGGALALAAAAGALLSFILHHPEPRPIVDVTTVRADRGARPALLNASGYVTPRRRATVAAKITARVNEIYAEEGIVVEAGQILAKLDDADARARLLSAQADRDATSATLGDLQVNLGNAERELQRTDALWKRGLVAEQALDAARTTAESLRARIALAREQVTASEARVQVARQDLENCTVRAPFTGVVVSKDAQRGEMVSPVSAGGGFTRTGIATIVDMSSLEIEVDVNESYIARVRANQPVTAVLDAYPDAPMPARVRTVIPTADRQKATVKVRATFDHLDPRILPDMGVKVTFLGDAPPTVNPTGRILIVPATAVRPEREGGGSIGSVFVYHDDDRLERRAVRLGQSRGGDQEILAGLTEGESVVVSVTGARTELRDGQRARVRR